AAHHCNVRRAYAGELIGDARLRHVADEDCGRAQDEGSSDVWNRPGGHGADVQVADSRGWQAADEHGWKADGDDAAVGGLTGDGAGWHSHGRVSLASRPAG